jgi:hypothetical protein
VGAGAAGYETDGVPDSAVGMAEDQYLVIRAQGQGSEDGVAAGGGVVHESEIVALGVEEASQRGSGASQGVREDGGHEAGRLPLHLVLPCALGGNDAAGRGAE